MLQAKKNGNTIDYKGLRYAESALAKMGVVNEIVKLQQKIMGTYCAIGINDKDLEFSDNLSSAFMSCSTFCQLYGAAVCFTDMTSIVRERVVEYPFELCLIHTHSAILANGLDPTTIRNMHGACNVNKLLDVYKSILTAELMDSRQAEYYSDFCLHGVEGCSKLDYELRRQPMEGFDRKSVLGERWVYQILDGIMVRYRLKLTEVCFHLIDATLHP